MNDDIKQLEGLTTENRHKILAETELKYKSIISELQDMIEYVDDKFNQSLNYKEKDTEFLIKSLLSVMRIQIKFLTDIRLNINKMHNEHNVELQYTNINLEILNQNISVLNDKISELKK